MKKQKQPIELKWKAVKADPSPSYNHWYVKTIGLYGSEICTTYADCGGVRAKQIVADHNAMLKANKSLKNTPFKTKAS